MSGTHSPRVVVVGSLNMDLVLRVSTLVRPGETIPAESLHTIPGGKGANQAIALARLGARVVMMGRVGDDEYGAQLRAELEKEGVDVEHVRVTPGCSSGIALINVAASGENSIVIVAGANGRMTPADVESQADILRDAKFLVVQNEISLSTVASAVLLAKRYGVQVIYDPAPAPREPLPPCLWEVDVFTPNHSEAESLTGSTIRSTADAIAAARYFRGRGAKCVVLKLGEQGALALDGDDQVIEVPAMPVNVVDTTAAGDAFTAAVAWMLSEGRSLADAVRWACAAGALSVTRHGAQPSLPTRLEVERFIDNSR